MTDQSVEPNVNLERASKCHALPFVEWGEWPAEPALPRWSVAPSPNPGGEEQQKHLPPTTMP